MGDIDTELTSTPAGQVGGQPSARPTSAALPDVQGDDEDRPVTLRELREAQRVLDERARRTQSAVDHSEARITRRIQQDLQGVDSLATELSQVGITLTPEQVGALRQGRLYRAFQEAELEPSQPPGTRGQATPSPAEQAAQYNPVSAAADAAFSIMADEYQVIVEQNDPEFAMIRIDTNKPSLFLSSVRDAAAAKRERLGLPPVDDGAAAEPQAAPPELPKARAGAGRRPPAPSSFEGMSSMEMLREAYKETTP